MTTVSADDGVSRSAAIWPTPPTACHSRMSKMATTGSANRTAARGRPTYH